MIYGNLFSSSNWEGLHERAFPTFFGSLRQIGSGKSACVYLRLQLLQRAQGSRADVAPLLDELREYSLPWIGHHLRTFTLRITCRP
jgi:hypothetical protein